MLDKDQMIELADFIKQHRIKVDENKIIRQATKIILRRNNRVGSHKFETTIQVAQGIEAVVTVKYQRKGE